MLTGCHKPARVSAQVLIEPQVTPQPARVGPAQIVFKLKDAAGNSISGAQTTLEANMSHAGMAPVFADPKEVTPGSYRCPFEFSMAGDWIMMVHITLPDGQKVEREFEVKGVRP
jgi:hypothetical protein